jgi:prepilin-type N-terminal cleavage/methylation domain-containing protein
LGETPIRRRVAGAGAQRRTGFTLVEVIVVLVILAILAAIAIPALTGYIDKARDKEYITQARDISIAVHSVLNEAVASGEITGDPAISSSSMHWFTTPGTLLMGDNAKRFFITNTSLYATSDIYEYFKRAAALVGNSYSFGSTDNRFFSYMTVALRGSDVTAATADGFVFELYPEGYEEGSGKPWIVVTHKIARITELDADGIQRSVSWPILFNASPEGKAHYDPEAGYEIYKLTL